MKKVKERFGRMMSCSLTLASRSSSPSKRFTEQVI